MRIFLYASLALVCLSCQPKELPTVLQADASVFVFKASHETTKTELSKVANVLAREYGINFDYSQSTFLDDERLRDFTYTVGQPGQASGKAVARLSNLQYTYYGFRLVLKEDKWQLQKIGAM